MLPGLEFDVLSQHGISHRETGACEATIGDGVLGNNERVSVGYERLAGHRSSNARE